MAHENEGHRKRLRERMMKEGLSNFQDHEILELLLFQYLPYKDTNKIAHNLLDKFGSIAGVLNASPDQLISVDGISTVTACNLAVLKEVWLRYKRSEASKIRLDGIKSIIEYTQKLISESYTEKLVVVYVDNSTRFIYRDEFTSDSAQQIQVDSKVIIATALRTNAAGVMLFHCHVNGPCRPSADDMRFSEKLFFALASINLVLLEHIIFNNKGDHYSFFHSGDIQAIETKYKNSQN